MSVLIVLLALAHFSAANPGKIILIVQYFRDSSKMVFHFLSILDQTKNSELKCYTCDPNTCTGCEWKRTESKVCILKKNTKSIVNSSKV